jgi:hypothetical protein
MNKGENEMKKIILLCVFLLFTWALLTSSNLCYSRKCDKCEYEVKTRVEGATHGVAWRDFSVKHKEINGKKYTTYRCDHGHCYLVNLDTGKAKFLEDKENE